MKIEEMMERKREYGYTNAYISEHSGIAIGTVQKIFSGETKNPRRETLLALEKVFTDPYRTVFRGTVYDHYPNGNRVLVREANLAEKYCAGPGGKHTTADLDRLPEDHRAELIDGVIYDLAAPSMIHQYIVAEILTALKNFVRSNGSSCIPLGSPVGVNVDCSENTQVQPDILVLCDRSKAQADRIWGAPDLMMEVLSPSTRHKDASVKLNKYLSAGVREYWLIDPMQKQITVCDFAHDDLFHHYSFHDSVPVGIWDGACRIDFREIADALRDLFGEEF